MLSGNTCYMTEEVPGTVAALVDGVRAGVADDHELLKNGMVVFDALYRGLDHDQPAPRDGSLATTKSSRKSGGQK